MWNKVWIGDNLKIFKEILFEVWFNRVCIEVKTIPFCESIMSFTNHSHSFRRGWLSGESDKRSCDKDNSRVLIIVSGTNLVCGSSINQCISTTSTWLHESDSSVCIQISWI